MKKKIRNTITIGAAFLLVAFFCFLPNIQAFVTDINTFGKSEKINLNPVEISAKSTQTTIEKLEIVNDNVLCLSVTPSARTVDGNDIERTVKKQINQLFKKMKISYRIDEKWKLNYKKLYTYISKQGNLKISDISDVSDAKNLLAWNITLSYKSADDDTGIALIMDAYTDQILAIDVYLSDYTKDWKDLYEHLEDIQKGFLSYLELDGSEKGAKKTFLENEKIREQYREASKSPKHYLEISGDSGVYAKQNKKQVYIPIEWSGYGFMINNVYN